MSEEIKNLSTFFSGMPLQNCTKPKLCRSQKIYDAVHGFIRFNELERMLIDSEPFQRLHHIHQLGIAYIVYPGATHTRFEHSLGTMELATRIFERILLKDFCLPDADYWMQIVRLAALCHDLGHLPFSHDSEKTLLGHVGHEEWTVKAIKSEYLKPIWEKLSVCYPEREVVNDILRMSIGEKALVEMEIKLTFSPVERVLSQVVTGDFFGADRIDYLLRDAQCTGVSYGLFDYHQLIEMLRVLPFKGRLELGIEENGIESCEALLLARHFMHQRVYQYSSVKAYKFHLIRFMKNFYVHGNYLNALEDYLSLSDNEILTALRAAAKDLTALGHLDADALMRREKRFKAVSMKRSMGEAELKDLQIQLGIPPNALYLESSPTKKETQEFCFPVQMHSGAIVSAGECSKILVPSVQVWWAFLSPEFEQAFRAAIEKSSESHAIQA